MRTVLAGIFLVLSIGVGVETIRAFATIGPPPPPITTFFGPGYARWQQERRVETNVGMRDAMVLDAVNNVGVPASLGAALVALILSFFGWPTRRVDRVLGVASGTWLLVVFALSVRFANGYRAGAATTDHPLGSGAVQLRVAAGGACAPPLNA